MTHCHPIESLRALRHPLLDGLLLGGLASAFAGCSGDDPLTGSVRSANTAPATETRVSIASDGRLGNGMEGYAWVAAGNPATVAAPSPCNDQGCFKDSQGHLCTSGHLPALNCTGEGTAQLQCDWATNWGVTIGLNAGSPGQAWGTGAPKTVSIAYSGGPGNYRLSAHVAGDPDSKNYCVDGYLSGLSVPANRMTSECWSGGGDVLAGFEGVDRISLVLNSAKHPIDFDFCIAGISLNAPADDDRVLIGDYGKLAGAMNGYAWVAGGSLATFTNPNPCNREGCFHSTGGRLCAQGSLPALACTGQGTAQYSCNWGENWGAMIGMNTTEAHTAWGTQATDHVAFRYSGGPGSYRLTAHVAGDPDAKSYCIQDYRSGQPVTASLFRTECWHGGGKPLADLAAVDSFALMITSEASPVAFDYCLSAISAY